MGKIQQADLARLLSPKSIAIIGGGKWGEAVIKSCKSLGFSGEIYAVHPTRTKLADVDCVASVAQLPKAPDAAFIGVNRNATIEIVQNLQAINAGGAICFASGFLESESETKDGALLQEKLLAAAQNMPIIGPNCYGFINYLEGAAIWPDDHGGVAVDRGIAILTQSSNIALNLSMHKRGLPIAFLGTVGNQAQIGISQIGMALLADPRITALALHIEGIDNLDDLQALATLSQKLNKPIIALKVGQSETAQSATISHTASIAGSQAGAIALFERLNIAQAKNLTEMIEALKIFHLHSWLKSNRLASMSCSGGEASLVADSALTISVEFPKLNERQQFELRQALGNSVALANPLDYHTYIWGNGEKLEAAFRAMIDPDLAMTLVVLDFPRSDRCNDTDWLVVMDALDRAKTMSNAVVGIISSLPENMPESIAEKLMKRGIVPLCGIDDALNALAITSSVNVRNHLEPIWQRGSICCSKIISEFEAKTMLSDYGIMFPKHLQFKNFNDLPTSLDEFNNCVVLKGEGFAHKTEAGAIRLNLKSLFDVEAATKSMNANSFILEQQINNAKLELLIGVVHDPAHGFVLTLALGGIWTELIKERVSLLLPASEADIVSALSKLKISKLIEGFRGQAPLYKQGIIESVLAIQKFVEDHMQQLEEIEINPLLVGENFTVAVDALIKMERT